MKHRILRIGLAACLCTVLGTTTVFGATLSLKYNGKNQTYKGKQLSVTYKEKTISQGKTPGIQINKVNMVSYYLVFYKNGPKVKKSYNKKTGRLQLTNGNKTIIFYKGKKYAYTNGKKRTFSVAPLTVKYNSANKSYIMVPAKFTAKYLGISYSYNSSKKTIDLAKPAITTTATSTATTETTTTDSSTYNVNATMSSYISKQLSACKSYGGKTLTTSYYKTYIDPAMDTTNGYQFLTLNTYRDVDTTIYNKLLDSKVKSTSVLKGKGSKFIAAAKKYNIDPVYLLCQTVLETGYGSSTLSQGKAVTEIVSGNSVTKDSKGNVTGFKKVNGKYITAKVSSTKVYNLYGIKAYDDAAQLCGFSYAYYMGWTSVDKAIDGAAQYLSSNYLNHATYKQNTLYKYRYNPNTSYIYHQYATDPAYAQKIASLMYSQFRTAYASNTLFTYERPVYK